MEGALQPAAVPPDFLDQIRAWADEQPNPVSVILFGSRARGDYGPKSDWDFAVVYEGERLQMGALPASLDGDGIDWIPMERSRAVLSPDICRIQHAVALHGHCLHGNPLPTPERNDVTFAEAWDSLYQGHHEINSAIAGLVTYWTIPEVRLGDYHPGVASSSAMAAKMLCKSALYLRGSKDAYSSHSVEELCDELERLSPADRLTPLLRECNGETNSAHFGKYADQMEQRERLADSEDRLVAVVRAYGAVLSALCRASPADEGRVSLAGVIGHRPPFLNSMKVLASSDCRPETLRALECAVQTWPLASKLWEDLMTDTPDQTNGQGRDMGASIGR